MTSAQGAFAALAGLFAVIGALLINSGLEGAGWVFVTQASVAFIMLGVMIVISALSRK